MTKSAAVNFLSTLVSALFLATLAGCSSGFDAKLPDTPVAPSATFGLRGSAHGGQQPVVGATIQLYEASTSGYGTPSHPLLPVGTTVTTDANGSFDITGMYTCDPGALVYITATGGNPGAGINSNLALMTALGPCSSLSSDTYIEVNELTTVASVYALSQFMHEAPGFVGGYYFTVGTTPTNIAGLTQAFADVNQLVDIKAGTAVGPALPAGATFSIPELDTLANILAACVNSQGVEAGTDTNYSCLDLFAYAVPPSGYAPSDTVMAAWNIVQNPATNVQGLFGLADPSGPFQPTLPSAPNDFTLAINYSAGGMAKPSSLAIDASGNVWITNRTGNSVTELTHAGVPVPGSPFTASVSAPSAIALDRNGKPWVADSTNGSLVFLDTAGGSSMVTNGGGLNLPAAIAIDAQGNIWVADRGANTVSEFNSAGAAVSSAGYSPSGISKPLGIAISPW